MSSGTMESPERNFVGNHLAGGAHAAQEGILGIGGPARQDDPVNTQRGHRQDEERPGVQVGNHQGNRCVSPVHSGKTSLLPKGSTAGVSIAGTRTSTGARQK